MSLGKNMKFLPNQIKYLALDLSNNNLGFKFDGIRALIDGIKHLFSHLNHL